MKYIPKTKRKTSFKYDYIQVGMKMAHLPIDKILITANKILYLEKSPEAYQDFINGASIYKQFLIDKTDSIKRTM